MSMVDRWIDPPDSETVSKWGRETAEHFALMDYSFSYWVHSHDPLFDETKWLDRDKVLPEWKQITRKDSGTA